MNYSPESVQRLLDSDDYGDRLSGVNQLRYLASEIAFEMLQPVINDSNARVRYSAVSQLDILGRQNPDLALTILRDRLLHDPEADVKAAAADAIGGLKLTAAYDDLVAVYQQSCDWLIQFSIVAALGELGEPRGFELLEIALNSDNELVKTAAVSLVPLANDDDWQLRYRLAQALGRLGGEDAIAVLTQLTSDKSAQVAQEARNNLVQG